MSKNYEGPITQKEWAQRIAVRVKEITKKNGWARTTRLRDELGIESKAWKSILDGTVLQDHNGERGTTPYAKLHKYGILEANPTEIPSRIRLLPKGRTFEDATPKRWTEQELKFWEGNGFLPGDTSSSKALPEETQGETAATNTKPDQSSKEALLAQLFDLFVKAVADKVLLEIRPTLRQNGNDLEPTPANILRLVNQLTAMLQVYAQGKPTQRNQLFEVAGSQMGVLLTYITSLSQQTNADRERLNALQRRVGQ